MSSPHTDWAKVTSFEIITGMMASLYPQWTLQCVIKCFLQPSMVIHPYKPVN